jgi:hypothetical protein
MVQSNKWACLYYPLGGGGGGGGGKKKKKNGKETKIKKITVCYLQKNK